MDRRTMMLGLPTMMALASAANGAFAQSGVSAEQAKHDAEPSGIDATLMRIGTYAATLKYSALSSAARSDTVRHIVDTVGCAIGGFDGPPCIAARKLAALEPNEHGATVYGQKGRATLAQAAFANGAMTRYLDFNDAYLTVSGGHISDMIPAILAAAESQNASGKDLILAVHIGYEVFGAICDTTRLRERGWDNSYLPGIGATAAIGRLFKMTPVQIANAVAMFVTSSVPLGVARTGELGNWKALAAAWSDMAAMSCARLAQLDVTGPPRAIEGHRGVWALVTGQFDISKLGKPVDGRTMIQRTAFKFCVTEYSAQAPAYTFLQLHKEGLRADQIKSIRIGSYFISTSEIGDRHKWDPQNKETADHSLVFIIAAILRDGKVTRDTYSQASILDPALRPMMNKISIYEDPALTAQFPKRIDNIIDIELTDGRKIHKVTGFAPGHPNNPFTDKQLKDKFHENCTNVVSPAKADHFFESFMALEGVKNLAPLMEELGDFG